MFRLFNWLWKLFILASVFGIGYIIGREHAFEEDEEWENDEDLKLDEEKKGEGAPAAIADGKATVFSYKNDKAEKVAVVGTFNDWNKDAQPMTREGEGWKATLSLKPGRYEYKFVVNNTDWICDPNCKDTVADKYGGKSSVIDIA